MPKRYVRGDRAFGRLLKQLPQEVTDELRAQLNSTGRTLLAQERRRAPVLQSNSRQRTPGALQSALNFYVTPKRLSLKVGLIGKAINRKIFYGWFDEWGRKGGGRGVKRKSAKYNAGVGALPPKHFVYLAGLRDQIYPAFRNIWEKALAKAGSQSDD